MWVGGWVGGGGGMQANTETSRSSARARAATTMSIYSFPNRRNREKSVFVIIQSSQPCREETDIDLNPHAFMFLIIIMEFPMRRSY